MQKNKESPNILWITTDHQRFDTIHNLGNEYIRTPNLDWLVKNGVSFNKAYCQSPVCTPSRASFLTGRYPRTNGIRQNGQEKFLFSWPNHFKEGIQIDSMVELVDVAPTLMEAVGLEVPISMQGKFLFPFLTGRKEADNHKKNVYCEYYNSTTNHSNPTPYATMIRNKRYKIVVYHGMELGELYDLHRDPLEFKNLWNEPNYSKIKNKMIKNCFDASVFILDPLPVRSKKW